MSAHSEAPAQSPATVDHFRLRDMLAVRRLEKETFGPHAFDAATFVYFSLARSHRFLVAREGEEMVGYVVARESGWRGPRQGHILSIAVRRDRRRRGLGAMLLTGILSQLREAGVEEVVLEVGETNHTAIHLYQRAGFQVDRTLPNFYGPGGHALRMVLTTANHKSAREAEESPSRAGGGSES